PALFHDARQRVEYAPHGLLQRVHVAAHEEEVLLNLLDRVVVRHHGLDAENLAQHPDRIDALRAAVLALTAHSYAAGQETQLHVLAQGRLTQLHTPLGEKVEQLSGGNSANVSPLRSLQFPFFQHLRLTWIRIY